MFVPSLSASFARSFSTSGVLNKPIKNVAIIGSGLMGSGIAQVSAAAKLNVVLVGRSDNSLKNAHQSIETSFKRIAKKKFAKDESAQKSFVDERLKYIRLTSNIAEAVKDADLIIESVVEDIDVKQKLFAEIESAASPDAILATNTSSLRLNELGANLKRKENFICLHFFNPVPLMRLLEIVRHEKTSDSTFNDAVAFGKAVGKTPVACKDTPGFIVNRLLVPTLFEAFQLAERGDATTKDIDTGMKLGAAHPMGPFELADYIGLDTMKSIQDGWRKADPGNPSFKGSKLVDKLVAEGKLGKKSGEGFYKY